MKNYLYPIVLGFLLWGGNLSSMEDKTQLYGAITGETLKKHKIGVIKKEVKIGDKKENIQDYQLHEKVFFKIFPTVPFSAAASPSMLVGQIRTIKGQKEPRATGTVVKMRKRRNGEILIRGITALHASASFNQEAGITNYCS